MTDVDKKMREEFDYHLSLLRQIMNAWDPIGILENDCKGPAGSGSNFQSAIENELSETELEANRLANNVAARESREYDDISIRILSLLGDGAQKTEIREFLNLELQSNFGINPRGINKISKKICKWWKSELDLVKMKKIASEDQELQDWISSIEKVLRECLASIPADKYKLEIEYNEALRSESGLSQFFFAPASIDVIPTNTNAAKIVGFVETAGEFNFTFGQTWLEYFGDTPEKTLDSFRQIVLAVIKGRFREYGKDCAYGIATFENGKEKSFGDVMEWLIKLLFGTKPRVYEGYVEL